MTVGFQEETVCRECGKELGDPEGLRRHQRVHSGYPAYVLKHLHGGVRPVCQCAARCGQQTSWSAAKKGYQDRIVGHHMTGQTRSAETKERIGRTNSVLMKEYMASHPEVAEERVRKMIAGATPESRARALQTWYVTIGENGYRERMSELFKQLWQEQREMMTQAVKKGGQTFSERAKAGLYDLESRNRKISESISRLYGEGGFAWLCGVYDSVKAGPCGYRSSWELAFYRCMDRDPEVESWLCEPFALSYSYHDENGHFHPNSLYHPDAVVLYTDGRIEMVEVKPEALRDHPRNRDKAWAGEQFCLCAGWSGYRYWPAQDWQVRPEDREEREDCTPVGERP